LVPVGVEHSARFCAALRSHTDGRQAAEVAIAAGGLNRMLELERPGSVRIMEETTA
jgi:hypothetical protein